MSVYFIGDPHLGHRAIAKYRPWVKDTADNTRIFVSRYLREIKKRDIVFFMGDVAFDETSLRAVGELPGRKILIKGNHDDFVSTSLQKDVFEEIHGMLSYKKMWLTHCPIHPDEMRGRVKNIHGHTHLVNMMKRNWYGKKIKDPRYVNTCVDRVVADSDGYYMFLSLDQIRNGYY